MGYAARYLRGTQVGRSSLWARVNKSIPEFSPDCACFYTDNFFIGAPYERHVEYRSADTFARDNATWLDQLQVGQRDDVQSRLDIEATRRRDAPLAAAARRKRIASEYQPLHPTLWTLRDEFLHPDFMRLVRERRLGQYSLTSPEGAHPQGLRKLAEGIYSLPVLSTHFCRMLCEELAELRASGLPLGRPNSMSTDGVQLDELGLSRSLIDPLIKEYLEPLCATLPAMAPFARGLDRHKAFVVRYRLGQDEHLCSHFDNAEVTLNVNLGHRFSGGELAFQNAPTGDLFYEWGDVGHAVLHLGRQVHAALPITEGVRENLVIWMRSTAWRKQHGCPMCGMIDDLLI